MPTWSAGDVLNLGKSGVNGGGTVYGGTVAGDVLLLQSTTNATKGSVRVVETTASSSTTTGALTVGGGLGVAGTLSTATLNVSGNITLGSVNGMTLTAPASSATLTVNNGQALTVSNSVSFAGTSGNTIDFGGTGGTITYLTSTPAVSAKTFTSPTLIAPTLGLVTASSLNLVSLSSAAASTLTIANAKKLQIDNGLTFSTTGGTPTVTFASGTLAYTEGTLGQFATTTSAQLASVLTDETGSGNVVFSASPTFTGTVVLGTASATTVDSSGYQIGAIPYITFVGGTAASPGTLVVGVNEHPISASATGNTFIATRGSTTLTAAAINNTLFGDAAGFGLTSGASNTFIGSAAGWTTATGSQNVAIGYDTRTATTTGSIVLGFQTTSSVDNQLVIRSAITQFKALGLSVLNTAGSSVLTLPVGSSTLATTSTTQTFTNKTLTSPLFSGGTTAFDLTTTTRVNGLAVTTTTGTLTAAAGTTTTVNESLTMSGSGGTVAFGGGGTVVYTSGSLAQFAQSTSATFFGEITDETGSGSLVFSSAPTFTGTLTTTGTAVVATLNSSTGYQLGGVNYLRYVGGTAATPNVLLVGPTNVTTCTGARNTVVGSGAGGSAMTAIDCTFIGHRAGRDTTSGNYATIIGAMGTTSSMTTGTLNTYVGARAGEQNRTGHYNTYVGSDAGTFCNTGADSNTYIGASAGRGVSNVTTGTLNIAIGTEALYSVTSGTQNTVAGEYAGHLNTSGSGNICLGFNAGRSNTTSGNVVSIGVNAGYFNTIAENVFIGTNAGLYGVSAIQIVYVGAGAGQYASGSYNTFIGTGAGIGAIGGASGASNTFIGARAGQSFTTADSCTLIGYQAGNVMTTSSANTLIGLESGLHMTTGTGRNTCVGVHSGYSITTGTSNTCIGRGAHAISSTATHRIALGWQTVSQNDYQFTCNVITHMKFFALETTGTGRLLVRDPSTAMIRGNTGVLTNASGTASTTTTTGTMIVYGGMGVSGAVNAGSISGFSAGPGVGNAGATPTLGNQRNLIFKGTTEQNDWTTVTNLLRSSSALVDSILIADDYSGGRTILTLDSGNNYGGNVLLQPNGFPRCHMFMRDSTYIDKLDSTGRNSPIWAQTQISKMTAVGAGYILTGATGYFGFSVSMDYFGQTLVVGGAFDNSLIGAVWFYNRAATGASFTAVGGSKIVPANVTGAAYVGYSVAVSADNTTVVMGAPTDNSNKGAFWVYNTLGTAISAKYTAGGGTGDPLFGISVAVSANGNTIAVGGRNDNSGVGATWVFYKSSATVWTQAVNATYKLVGTGSTGASRYGDRGGSSISYDGNTIAVGGFDDNSNTGAVVVFTRSNGTGSGQTWAQLQPKILGTGATGAGRFGYGVALSGDARFLAVGATDDSPRGAVWIFEFQNDKYIQLQSKLKSHTTTGYFGAAVSFSADGSTLIVGSANGSIGVHAYFLQSDGYFERRGGVSDGIIGTGGTGSVDGFGDNNVAISGLGNIMAVGNVADSTDKGAVWTFK